MGTAGTWLEALTANRSWIEDQDLPRIQTAFANLAVSSESWPSPKQFLDALPALPQTYYVAPPLIVDERRKRVGMQHIADISKKLGITPDAEAQS